MDYIYRIEIEPITLVLDEFSRPYFVQTTNWNSRLGKLPAGVLNTWGVSKGITKKIKTAIKPNFERGIKGEHLDHINRNQWDWRESNLRVVTYTENNQNKSKKGEGYNGFNISYIGQTKEWQGFPSEDASGETQ